MAAGQRDPYAQKRELPESDWFFFQAFRHLRRIDMFDINTSENIQHITWSDVREYAATYVVDLDELVRLMFAMDDVYVAWAKGKIVARKRKEHELRNRRNGRRR